ncbi:MAG: serine hydrolase [Crocinitomix sp.]|nr:serine hydrolase [Crocinitomix sp.]
MNLEDEILRIKKEWDVQGMSVGLIKNGEVIFCKNFGYANKESEILVDNTTLFPIASCTKSFTAALLYQTLIGNKADAQTNLWDLFFTAQEKSEFKYPSVNFEALASHTSGWNDGDIKQCKEAGSEMIDFEKMKLILSESPLKGKWKYSNEAYLLMGEIIAKVSNMAPWNHLKNQILLNANMTQTCSLNEPEQLKCAAIGYQTSNVGFTRITPELEKNNTPTASGIWSSAADLLQWLQLWLNQGELNGQQILSQTYIQEAIKMKAIIANEDPFKEEKDFFVGYGYGWFVDTHQGVYRVGHSGSIEGYSCMTGFFPGEKSGFVVLTNQGNSEAVKVFTGLLSDWLLECPSQDWNTIYKKRKNEFLPLTNN